MGSAIDNTFYSSVSYQNCGMAYEWEIRRESLYERKKWGDWEVKEWVRDRERVYDEDRERQRKRMANGVGEWGSGLWKKCGIWAMQEKARKKHY